MKSIVNFLNEASSAPVKIETTLYNFIQYYFNGVDKKSLEAADALYELNDFNDDYDTNGQFKTYNDWFDYFEKHKNDTITVTIKFTTVKYGPESLCYFSLPDVEYNYEWDCIDTPNEARDTLRELNKKNQ